MRSGIKRTLLRSLRRYHEHLFIRTSRTVHISAVAIARHMFRQSFPGNFNPHSRRVTNGPTVFAIRRWLITTPDEFGFYRRLVVILNRGREVGDIGLVLGVLTLPKI